MKRDEALWNRHHFIWKEHRTWVPQLTTWLGGKFRNGGIDRLKPGKFRNICWDDSAWRKLLGRNLVGNIDEHVDELATAIDRSSLRTYHGCRTDDAGIYFRDGLRVHDRDAMLARLHAIIRREPELEWVASRLETALADVDNTIDIGRLFVVAEDTSLLEHAAHYLIYGSEWIAAVLVRVVGHREALLRSGVPTLLEIDLPLCRASPGELSELAQHMLGEWTRVTCNRPDWHAPIDFTFRLEENIPPAFIVGHSHPIELKDPLERRQTYRSPAQHCAHCRP